MGRTDSALVVVADAGPLIHLDELEVISLLEDFASVCIPHAVWREVEHHRPGATEKMNPAVVRRLEPVQSLSAALVQWGRSLSLAQGELEALHWMEALEASVFLTDDAAARVAAVQMGHRVHGTIGILLRAVRRGCLPMVEAESLLRDIPTRSTLHVRAELLFGVLRELKTFPGDKNG